ncbi:MAG: deoxyribodipyrimidine photo-lyase [Roseiflexaceae bacterium]
MIHLHWFRRDLRLHDNPALHAALEQHPQALLPVFILDDAILHAATSSPARVDFMLASLRALDQQLRERGSRLILRRGSSLEVLLALVREQQVGRVYWNEDYTPAAQKRDRMVRQALEAQGIDVQTCRDVMLLPPDLLKSGQGTPYTVFTPFRKRWWAAIEQRRDQILAEHPLPAMAAVPADCAEQAVPRLADLGLQHGQVIPPGGEQAGLERLESFARIRSIGGMERYATGRDLLAEAGTSRLSAYLRLGVVAPQAALRRAIQAFDQASEPEPRAGIETWISELAWRDFYYQIMANFPHVLRGAFKPQYDALQWENNADWFAAWQQGRTGYPIIDAAMRQLATEAWMHNRARMIVASFLTKDLLIDWRWGERFFMQQLVDGDPAANNGGWQWAAGTGTDAQPYFRIFNPISQGEKFDPEGRYVRRYLPELARVPNRFIHAPWLMPPAEQRNCGVIIGRDYPQPIVDHATQRDRALAMYKAARA